MASVGEIRSGNEVPGGHRRDRTKVCRGMKNTQGEKHDGASHYRAYSPAKMKGLHVLEVFASTDP